MNEPAVEVYQLRQQPTDEQQLALHGLYEETLRCRLPAERIRANVQDIVRHRHQRLYVADFAGELIGAATLTLKTGIVETSGIVDDIAISQTARIQRPHRRLMEHLCRTADEEGLMLRVLKPERRHEMTLTYRSLMFEPSSTGLLVRRPLRRG